MFHSLHAIVVITAALVAWRLTRNYFKVRAAPGPLIASCTSLWQFHVKRTGRFMEKLQDLHAKYGPVVRYAPNTVSVSDPALVHTVYGFSPVWNKAESYTPMIGMSNGTIVPSVISMMDEDKHTALRRPIAPAFSSKAVLAYERFIDETADELVEALSRLGSFDLARWMQYYTMDVLSRIAFSESLGFVSQGSDIGKTMSTIEERFAHWNPWSALPALEWAIFKNPLYLRLTGSTTPLTALAADKIRRRTTGASKGQDDLLQKYLEASRANPHTIDNRTVMGVTMSTIAAGADTTAIALACALYNLLQHPSAFAKLQSEITAATARGIISDPPTFSELNHLPYLDAVVKEALRCWPVFTAPIERVVPPGGLTVAGKHLPAGTVVGCHQGIIHADQGCYGADAGAFNPERWINASEAQKREMDKASIWFGAGKHVCIGRHIAMLEIKKLIPRLMGTFKMTLDDPSAPMKSRINAVSYVEPIPVTFEVL